MSIVLPTTLEDLALPQDIVSKIEAVNRAVDPPVILIFDFSQLSKFFDLLDAGRTSNSLVTSASPMNLQGKII
jgi:hypothetical protein